MGLAVQAARRESLARSQEDKLRVLVRRRRIVVDEVMSVGFKLGLDELLNFLARAGAGSCGLGDNRDNLGGKSLVVDRARGINENDSGYFFARFK